LKERSQRGNPLDLIAPIVTGGGIDPGDVTQTLALAVRQGVLEKRRRSQKGGQITRKGAILHQRLERAAENPHLAVHRKVTASLLE